jgi:hypothetical protein
MGILTASHAWSVTLSVVFAAFVMGMLAFVTMMPGTLITPFLLTMSATLSIAVGFHAWNLYNYETERAKAHTKLSDPHPEKCPDYWTSEYDECKGAVKCLSYFDASGDAADRIFMSAAATPSQLYVGDYATKAADEICTMDQTRSFPWMDVTNPCIARNRTV